MHHLIPASMCRLFFIFLLIQTPVVSQTPIRIVCGKQPIALETSVLLPDGDSVVVQTLRLYIGHLTWWQQGRISQTDANYYLIDLENPASMSLPMPILPFDSLSFNLGVDSATTTSGVMGGALDPTKGMFWTWQSGYINVKLEGYSNYSSARNHAMEYHLGGYLAPWASQIQTGVKFQPGKHAALLLDIQPFLLQTNRKVRPQIMSPGAEAVHLMQVLAHSFKSLND